MLLIVIFLENGWVRNLVAEGIEPNPGPSWKAFTTKTKVKMEGLASEIENDNKLATLLENIRKSTPDKNIDTDHITPYLDSAIDMDKTLKKWSYEVIQKLDPKSKGKISLLFFEISL
jgi:hypothetical protein